MATRPRIGPLSTVNERLVAIEIVRQVLHLRFSLRVRKLVIDAINDTEHPIASMIRESLQSEAGLRTPAQVRQLDVLIARLNALRQPAWQVGIQTAEAELAALADAEPEDQRSMFAFLLPGVELLLPSVGIGLAALAMPFQGRTLRQWFLDAQADDQRRMKQAIYAGVGAGESPSVIARRVVGSANNKGRDGTTQTTRNQLDTIVRSGTVHAVAYGREQFYQINSQVRYTAPPLGTLRPPVRAVGAPEDPVEAEARRQARQAQTAADNAAGGPGIGGSKLFTLEQYVAVLDSRTTKLCRGLDGKRFPLGEGPIPPLHMNCRSNRILVLPDKVGGPLYDPGSYADWIRSQPEAVQVLLMGSTKDHKLSAKDLAEAGFQDYAAKPMTLDQVRSEARRIMEYF